MTRTFVAAACASIAHGRRIFDTLVGVSLARRAVFPERLGVARRGGRLKPLPDAVDPAEQAGPTLTDATVIVAIIAASIAAYRAG